LKLGLKFIVAQLIVGCPQDLKVPEGKRLIGQMKSADTAGLTSWSQESCWMHTFTTRTT